MKQPIILALALALLGFGVLFVSRLKGDATGGILTPDCNGTFSNTTSTVNSTATRILVESNYNCGAYIRNASPVTIYCTLDGKTAPSSSAQIGSPYRLESTTSTNMGPTELRLGTAFNGFPFSRSVNCVATPTGTINLIYK